jgi:hypothetical protein
MKVQVQLLEESRKAKPTHPLLGQQQKPNFIHIFPSHDMVYYTFVHQFCRTNWEESLCNGRLLELVSYLCMFFLQSDELAHCFFSRFLHAPTNVQVRMAPLRNLGKEIIHEIKSPFKKREMLTILSIDGGGVRGIIPATILEYLENELQVK